MPDIEGGNRGQERDDKDTIILHDNILMALDAYEATHPLRKAGSNPSK